MSVWGREKIPWSREVDKKIMNKFSSNTSFANFFDKKYWVLRGEILKRLLYF